MNRSKLQLWFVVAIETLRITVIWIPVYIARCILVKFVALILPSYGKILDHFDICVEEDYTQAPPKYSMVFTLVLDGNLRADELKQLFSSKVLQARMPAPYSYKIRYPELKQYQVSLAGYKFWCNDPTFHIDNHIQEQTSCWNYAGLSTIHQEMLNKSFKKDRSPWEIILLQNHRMSDSLKTLMIFRVHHTLGDTKSILKILVECLGGKPLKLPRVKECNKFPLNCWEKFTHYALLPLYVILSQVQDAEIIRGMSDDHPLLWVSNGKRPPLNVGISVNLSLMEIKSIANKHKVTTSAVIMSLICGVIRKADSRFRLEGIPCRYVLPKPNHPGILANHHNSAIIVLPTNESSKTKLLQICNNMFLKARFSHLHKHAEVVTFQRGTLIHPLREKLEGSSVPLMITNIAGDTEGFQVGSYNVSDFMMSCAPFSQTRGIIVCAFSYKDSIRVAVTAKDGILSQDQTQTMANLIKAELNEMKLL